MIFLSTGPTRRRRSPSGSSPVGSPISGLATRSPAAGVAVTIAACRGSARLLECADAERRNRLPLPRSSPCSRSSASPSTGCRFTTTSWSRSLAGRATQVTSGNAFSKLLIGPLFGFAAGWIVDRFGPRRLMIAGILMAGSALVGLGYVALWMFYFFYLFNALGYVCGGRCPTRCCYRAGSTRRAVRRWALRISASASVAPRTAALAAADAAFGWHGALQVLGMLIVLIALPMAFFVRESRRTGDEGEPRGAGSRSPRSASCFAVRPSTCWRSAACARSARSAARTST